MAAFSGKSRGRAGADEKGQWAALPKRKADIRKGKTPMDRAVKEYRYFFRLERYVWPVILSFLISLYLFSLVGSNRGLILQRIIRLGPKQASVFFFVLGALITAINLWAIAGSLLMRKNLVIERDRIVIPIMTGKAISVFYRSIAYIIENEMHNQRIATIVTKQNKKIFINANMLDSAGDYQEILTIINEKLNSP